MLLPIDNYWLRGDPKYSVIEVYLVGVYVFFLSLSQKIHLIEIICTYFITIL